MAIAANSLCSSSMLLLNKLAIHLIPMPSSISVVQLIFCTLVVFMGKHLKLLSVDDFERSKVLPCLAYVASFVGGLYANMRALEIANVDTIIVFRSITPLFVCGLDYFFLGRALPKLRSLCSLLGIAVGSLGYVLNDKEFHMKGVLAYTWVTAYMLIICFSMTYGKYLISGIKWGTPVWGNVYYVNVLSILPMLSLGLMNQEWKQYGTTEFTANTLCALLASCCVGMGISYTGFQCRSLLSATSYTLIGVVNKLITILLNVVLWDRHASGAGMACLLMCMLSSSLYSPAPLRKGKIYTV